MDRPVVESPDGPAASVPSLLRVLTLWDLIVYGLITVSPSGPINIFGVVLVLTHGQAILAVLNGMVATVLTAVSLGRMAALYPSAGSAYTYAARGLNPQCGLIAGWGMLLDYVAMPLFCVIFGALLIVRLLPQIPYAAVVAVLAGTITILNLCGIGAVAKINRVILTLTVLVFAVFVWLAVHYLFHHAGWGGLISTHPLYNARTFQWDGIAAGTSFAALSYLGFDSVSTLAEEVRNPRRNVLIAIVGVVILTGIFTCVVIYIGQRVWPDYNTFTNIDTGFMDVVHKVGGGVLYVTFTALLILTTVGSGVTALGGAARLLFGFGRDNMLPPRIFAYLSPKSNNPTRNILILGATAFLGALLMSYELASEILVFGAFVGFAVVNLAVIRQFYIVGVPEHKKHLFTDLIMPGLAFLFCVAITLGLPASAKVVGGVWFAGGFAYHIFHTRQRGPKSAVLSD